MVGAGVIKLTIKQLYAVKELAATSSFTVAAAHLHTTQSNLSTTIREAESVLGVRLFDRTTKAVSLTATGREFVRGIDPLLEDLQAQVDNVRSVGQLRKGRLAVGFTPLLGSTLLAGPIARFNLLHPDIDIRLEDATTAELFSHLLSQNIEIAIGTFAGKSSEIEIEALFDDPLIVLSHASLDLPDQVSWELLSRQRLVGIVDNSSVGKLVKETFKAVCARGVQTLVQSHHWLSVIALTESLRAACIAPRYTMAGQRTGSLRCSSLVQPTLSRQLGIAYLKGKSLSPAAMQFTELLKRATALHLLTQ
ncbi:LysR family transcriptional regulator [Verticiella sediminum]